MGRKDRSRTIKQRSELSGVQRKILDVLERHEPLSIKKMAEIGRSSKRDVKKAVKGMVKMGVLVEQKDGMTKIYERDMSSEILAPSFIIKELHRFDFRERYVILVLFVARKYRHANPFMIEKEIKMKAELHMIRSTLSKLETEGYAEIIRPQPLTWKITREGLEHLQEYESMFWDF